MKQRIHDALLGLVGLAGLAFFALSGASCESPSMQCAVGHGPFTVVYEVTSGDASCYENVYRATGEACAAYELADDSLPDCAGLSKVESVGFATYLTPKGRREIKDTTGKVTAVDSDGADYNIRNIAIQSATMGATYRSLVPTSAEPPAGATSYAFGPYTEKPDAGDLCYAGGANGSAPLAVAKLDFPDDGVNYQQTWSDIKFFVTTGVPGTQVIGKMKFEDLGTGCSVEYKFTGLYPAVFCGSPIMGYIDANNGMGVAGHEDNDVDPNTDAENDTDDDGDAMTAVTNDKDDDGNPNTDVTNDKDDDGDPRTPVTDDDGTPGPDVDVDEDELLVIGFDPDDTACDPKGDPAAGRPLGSGINPDFQTYCHPDYLHCILKEGTGLIP